MTPHDETRNSSGRNYDPTTERTLQTSQERLREARRVLKETSHLVRRRDKSNG